MVRRTIGRWLHDLSSVDDLWGLATLHVSCKTSAIMDLPAYIEEIGNGAAAREFRASYSAVVAWRKGKRTPRPAKARYIERRTAGRVTVAEIYGGKASVATR